jgi:predicted O-methyltransferase YrrM
VQRLLREQGLRFVQNVWQPGAPQPGHRPPEDAAQETQDADEGDRDDERADHAPTPRMPAVAGGRLPREEVAKLKAALAELSECRRLLDAALGGKT